MSIIAGFALIAATVTPTPQGCVICAMQPAPTPPGPAPRSCNDVPDDYATVPELSARQCVEIYKAATLQSLLAALEVQSRPFNPTWLDAAKEAIALQGLEACTIAIGLDDLRKHPDINLHDSVSQWGPFDCSWWFERAIKYRLRPMLTNGGDPALIDLIGRVETTVTQFQHRRREPPK